MVVGLSPRARHGVACVARRAGTAVEVACRLRPAGSEVLESRRTAPGARHCPEFGARAAIHRRLALHAVALGGRRELGCRPRNACCCSRPCRVGRAACLEASETNPVAFYQQPPGASGAGSLRVLACLRRRGWLLSTCASTSLTGRRRHSRIEPQALAQFESNLALHCDLLWSSLSVRVE